MNLLKNTIIIQAIELGFDFEIYSENFSIEEIEEAMLNFFQDNADELRQVEDECEVDYSGRTQSVVYGDYQCSGEIVNFSDHWHKSPDTKVFHSNLLIEEDGLIKQVNLYYLVGETDYNAPDGYRFNPKTKRHEEFNV